MGDPLSGKANPNICLVASSGGHLTQLLRLSQAWTGYRTFVVTTKEMVRDSMSASGQIYVVGECNRQTPIKGLGVFWQCIKAVLRERPSVVISTGAAVGAMMCWLAKLQGAKIVWVDSIANISKLSLSGRLVRPIADVCMTQWPDVARLYGDVDYVGAVV